MQETPPEGYVDGCTSFPEEIAGNDLTPCCNAHDVAYWVADTVGEKFAADIELFQCVLGTGNDLLTIGIAAVMFVGVAIGGTYFWISKDKRWKKNETN